MQATYSPVGIVGPAIFGQGGTTATPTPKAIQSAAWLYYVARCAARDQRPSAALYDESSRLVDSVVFTWWSFRLAGHDGAQPGHQCGFARRPGVNSKRSRAWTFSPLQLPDSRRAGKPRPPSGTDTCGRRSESSLQRTPVVAIGLFSRGIRIAIWRSFYGSPSAR